ncbi:MAG TPA: PfkB family carbohydrate kinase [Bdellovibrionota bacterium]|nr:PfkB family carbohydrate kinase [Bdellovibrionota bacterium]
MKRVIGLGQCSLDYLAVVDPYPPANSKVDVLEWDEQGGGPVATALVTLSMFGVSCSFCGVIGDDHEGKKIRDDLIRSGIDVAGLRQRAGHASQVAFIAVEKGTGNRTVFCRRSTGPDLAGDELPDAAFSGAGVLLVDGVMPDACLRAAEEAEERNVPVLLDAGRIREGTLRLIGHCDYVVGSTLFAEQLGWTGDPASFQKRAASLGFRKALTLTFGERGSVTFEPGASTGDRSGPKAGRWFKTSALSVKALDTTGAGDVFHGAYCYGILKGWPLDLTLEFASAAAALKCKKLGGRSGIPTLDAVFQHLQHPIPRS